MGILASELPLLPRRILVAFHVRCKQSWRHNVPIRNIILAVLVMPKFPFPLGIFTFFVFLYKRNRNVRNLNGFEVVQIVRRDVDHIFMT